MRILITAGPTREWMDPVRFLSNLSSGAMGIAIAEALRRRGHRVTLVLGPTPLSPSKKIKVHRVETALEMFAAVKRSLSKADAFVASAAVGDFRFKTKAVAKMKKGLSAEMTVQLVKNPDILAWAGEFKRKKNLVLVGFALETDRREANAREKLKHKNLDLIVGNGPGSLAAGTIHPLLIEPNEKTVRYPLMSKEKLAGKLADWLEKKWKKTTSHNL